jgi:hypothetical protein
LVVCLGVVVGGGCLYSGGDGMIDWKIRVKEKEVRRVYIHELQGRTMRTVPGWAMSGIARHCGLEFVTREGPLRPVIPLRI